MLKFMVIYYAIVLLNDTFQIYLDASKIFGFCLIFIQVSEGLRSSHQQNVLFKLKGLRTVILESNMEIYGLDGF